MNWRDIKGYEGFYQVSDTGLIKSIGRNIRKRMYGGKFETEQLAKQKYDELIISNPELFRPTTYKV